MFCSHPRNAEGRQGIDMIEHNVTINGIVVNAEYSEQSVDGIFIPLLKQLTQQRQLLMQQKRQLPRQLMQQQQSPEQPQPQQPRLRISRSPQERNPMLQQFLFLEPLATSPSGILLTKV